MAQLPQSPFLRLPVEIRLMIYHHLLLPPSSPPSSLSTSHVASKVSSRGPEGSGYDDAKKVRVLRIRMLDPTTSLLPRCIIDTYPKPKLRSRCVVRTGHFGSGTMSTTYTCTNNNSPGFSAKFLGTCRQVHDEAAEVLYSTYTFDFDIHVEAIVPFLGDLTETARRCVRSIGVTKKALPYEREFDRCEWDSATTYLATSLPGLRALELGVVAGKPGPQGWDIVPAWSKDEFVVMARLRDWAGFEWVKELSRIKVEQVRVRALVEYCPLPKSEVMAFWVGLSKSVESGFAEWVRELMIADC